MGVKVVARPGGLAQVFEGGIPEAMKRASLYLQSSADRKIKAGVRPANSPLTAELKKGNNTLRDTNSLAASIAPNSGALWAEASTKKKQARILQEGGTIRPKKAKALWIPARRTTLALMKKYGTTTPAGLIAAMEADDYGFYKTGGVFLAYKKGRKLKSGRRGRPGMSLLLFYIRGSVKIPARPFLYIDGKDMGNLMAIISVGIEKKVREKWRGKK